PRRLKLSCMRRFRPARRGPRRSRGDLEPSATCRPMDDGHGSCSSAGGPRGPAMRFRPSGFPAVTFAGPLAAAGALLSVTTPGSARAAMPPSEAAAPVSALLADPARLVAWLRARNADVGAAAARVR